MTVKRPEIMTGLRERVGLADAAAEVGCEGFQGFGIGAGRVELLLERAGGVGAGGEAVHAEGASQLVRGCCSFFPLIGRQGHDRGRGLEEVEASENLRQIAGPEISEDFPRGAHIGG